MTIDPEGFVPVELNPKGLDAEDAGDAAPPDDYAPGRRAHRRLGLLGVFAVVIGVIALFLPRAGAGGEGVAFGPDDAQRLLDELCIPPGEQGEPGPAGPTGEAGEPGESGEPGQAGATGVPGLPGICGLSAYEVWLLLGNSGSEDDFIAALTGPAGAAGSTGATGATGETGETGATGLTGATGPVGPPGPAGPVGLTGATGPAGPPGPQGETGPQGEVGPEGPPGTGGLGDRAAFWDQCIQLATVVDQPYEMRFSHTDTAVTSGISIPGADGDDCDDPTTLVGSPGGSVITFTRPGIYNIEFSAQVQKTQGGTASDLSVWLRRNGSDVPWTNTDFTTEANNAARLAALNWFVPVTCVDSVCDTYELVWSANELYFELLAVAPGVRPGIPSIILTVDQVG
jgi:hypothetical protein